MLTSLLLGDDPTTLVCNKDKLHSHLLEVLETKVISPFRPAKCEAKIEK